MRGTVTSADLLRLILLPENFADDGLRLAYADLCEEEGEQERAEFVRDPIPRDEWNVGAAVILCSRRGRQPDSLGLLGVGRAVVRHGFVSEVWLPCADWLRHGPALVRCQPLERVRLTDREPVRVSSGLWEYPVADGGWLRGAIPWAVYDRFPDWPLTDAETARAALCAACLSWARETERAS